MSAEQNRRDEGKKGGKTPPGRDASAKTKAEKGKQRQLDTGSGQATPVPEPDEPKARRL